MLKSRTKIIAGRYELIRVVGTGGMAAVWRGEHRDGDSVCPVAIKRILVDIARDPEVVALFREEARVGRQLNHPNIVQVLDYGMDDDGASYLVMEWVEGVDMFDYMRSFHGARVHVPWQAVAAIGFQALRGLVAAHERLDAAGRRRPVIHRDLTPSNILIGLDGVVKVADFGLARAMDRATITFPNMIKGKVSYTAPELLRGRRASEKSDIYCLGVTLWEALAARKLFPGDSNVEVLRAVQVGKVPPLRKFRPDVPGALINIVHRAIACDPAERPSSARVMANEVLALVRAIQPPVDAKRLGASVAQAKERLRAIDDQIPVAIEESKGQSFEISVDMEVDFAASPSSARSFRAELSEPFES